MKTTQTEMFTTRLIDLPSPTPVVENTPVATEPPPQPPAKPPTPKLVHPVATAMPTPPLAQQPVETALNPAQTSTLSEQEAALIHAEIPVERRTRTPVFIPASAFNFDADTNSNSNSNVSPTLPAFSAQESGLHAYTVSFTVNSAVNQGDAEVRWQQDGQKYALSLAMRVLMLDAITWKSKGTISAQGLQPERFSDKRFRKSEVAAHFDRVQGKIIFSSNTPEAPLETTAQDRISIIWHLAGLLAAEPKRYPAGSILTFQTVDDTEAQTWLFTVNEAEIVNLDSGPQIALRLTRNPRREFDQKVELWFAPAMGYLPIRFRLTQTNGDYRDFMWRSSQALPNQGF